MSHRTNRLAPGLLLLAIWYGSSLIAGQAAAVREEVSPSEHPLGRLIPPDRQVRVAVKDFEVPIRYPVVEGERIVLSAVGTEMTEEGREVFQPLVAVLVDKSFPESPEGEWLAVWNLGKKSPGFFSRIRAAIPAFVSRKRSNDSRLEKLNLRLDRFEQLWDSGRIRPPMPGYDLNRGFRQSMVGLVLSGLKTTIGVLDVTYLGEFLFRGYLLRRKDYQERDFAQTYLGLLWYADIAAAQPGAGALSPEDVRQIKFRMLANRNILGRWVKPQDAEDFVHGFESEMRDHLWGTSNFLASAANEYRLGYEELQRYTAGGVPMALGGILYYDARLAPAPDQIRWSLINPFDLTYNPFREPAVLEAAASGKRVPLAVYTYQSNLALKPIITIDFFRPKNPKLREAATYWRRLGNEAVSSTRIGFVFGILNRTFRFVSNRKGLTWFSDMKLALGIEELRLSLLSGLYFEPSAADEMLDQIDRVLVNPLVQSSREQRLRARLQYRALLADEGQACLLAARRLRDRHIRKVFDWRPRPIGEPEYAAYRSHLQRQNQLDSLRIYMKEPYVSSLPQEEIAQSIEALGREVDLWDEDTVETLHEFRLTVVNRPALRSEFESERARLVEASEVALGRIYRQAGRSGQDLRQDIEAHRERRLERARKYEKHREKVRAEFFLHRMKDHMRTLEEFVGCQGDLAMVSPWYLDQALEFFQQAPKMLEALPTAAKNYSKHEARIQTMLLETERQLASNASSIESDWLRDRRAEFLRNLRDQNTAGAPSSAPSRILQEGKTGSK